MNKAQKSKLSIKIHIYKIKDYYPPIMDSSL